MSDSTQKLPEVVNFPDPRPTHVPRTRISLNKPSIDTILNRMNPAKLKLPSNISSREPSNPQPVLDEAELHDEKEEIARLKAESIERMREAKELELLLQAREKHLDMREAQITDALAKGIPERGVSGLETSLNDANAALEEANESVEGLKKIIADQRHRLEQFEQQDGSSSGSEGRGPRKGYDAISDPSLEEQVAFLKEREAFIEESENVLFDKAQHLQEWEARLEQEAHDLGNGATPIAASS